MNEEFVIESIKTELLRRRTSLSKLGTDQANAPDFGKGRPILIYGPCQSGKSQEICLPAWLAYFCFETVPFIFVMNHGGLGIIPLIMGAVARFNDVIDHLVKSVVPRCSKKEMMRYHLYATERCFNPALLKIGIRPETSGPPSMRYRVNFPNQFHVI